MGIKRLNCCQGIVEYKAFSVAALSEFKKKKETYGSCIADTSIIYLYRLEYAFNL